MKEIIPYDLFPTYEKNIKGEWESNTFHVAHIFHKQFKSKVATTGSDDLQVWIKKAKDIMTDLKKKGLARALDKIELMAKEEFQLKFPEGELVRNVNDVFVLFQDNDWYNQNKERKRNYLHMLQYGIFRVGNDDWARTLEREWMDEHQVIYDDVKNKEKKGCILKLIMSRASDTIGKRFGETSRRCLDEIIVVRKNSKRNNDNTITEAKCFNGFHMGYLIRKKPKPSVNDFTDNDKVLPSMFVDDYVDKLVCHSKEMNISIQNLICIIEKRWNKDSQKGKFV